MRQVANVGLFAGYLGLFAAYLDSLIWAYLDSLIWAYLEAYLRLICGLFGHPLYRLVFETLRSLRQLHDHSCQGHLLRLRAPVAACTL